MWSLKRVRLTFWRSPDLAALIVLVALIMFVGWVRLWHQGVFVDWDVVTFYLPWYTFLGQHIRHFDIPGWNPYLFSGMPFAADPQSGWGYLPAMVTFAFFPPLAAYKIFVLFHLLLGAVSTYAFTRLLGFRTLASFAGAAAFTFGGTLGASGCCTIQVQLVVWIPVALVGIELAARSHSQCNWFLALSLSGVAVSQMLAAWVGQGTFYGLLLVGSYLAFRLVAMPAPGRSTYWRRVLDFVASGTFLFAIGFGLGAGALLPRLEAVSRTFVGGAGYQDVNCGPYCGNDWWSTLRLTMSYVSWWFPYYIGGAALACASIGVLAARRRRILIYFVALTWVILVLPMRPTTTTRLLFLIPRFEGLHLHDPSRALSLLPIGIAILVAAAVEEFPRITRSSWAIAIPFGLRAVWWFFVLSVPLASLPVATFTGRAFLGVSLVAGLGAILATQRLAARRWSIFLGERVLPVLLVVLILWDPAGHAMVDALRDPTSDPRAEQAIAASASSVDLSGAGEFLQQQQTNGDIFRYFGYVSPPDGAWQAHEHYYVPSVLPTLMNNRSILLGFQDVQGYDPAHLVRYRSYFQEINGLARDYHEELVYSPGLGSPLLDLLNVRFILVPNNALTDPARDSSHLLSARYRQVFSNGDVQVFENPNALPRAWLVHDVSQVTADDALKLLASADVDPRATALIEGVPPNLQQPPAGSDDSVTITNYENDQIILSVNAATDGMVMLSEVYDPGWRAYIDGKRTTVYQADYILRGVAVPAGDHEIVLRYEPDSLRYGFLISLASTLAVFAIIGWGFVTWWFRGKGRS
jgi:Bacterial membrane protein YfhO